MKDARPERLVPTEQEFLSRFGCIIVLKRIYYIIKMEGLETGRDVTVYTTHFLIKDCGYLLNKILNIYTLT